MGDRTPSEEGEWDDRTAPNLDPKWIAHAVKGAVETLSLADPTEDSDAWAIRRLRELRKQGEHARPLVGVSDGLYRVVVLRADGSIEEAPR